MRGRERERECECERDMSRNRVLNTLSPITNALHYWQEPTKKNNGM